MSWRHAGILLGLALREKEGIVSGTLEAVWTSECVNEEHMAYCSDSDNFVEYADSDER